MATIHKQYKRIGNDIMGPEAKMQNEKKSSRKENYINENNINSKSSKWLSEISLYAKNRGRFKFVPSHSILLVIDMQRYFLSEESHAFIPSSKAIVPNIKSLVDIYRKFNLPIIFTRHSYKEDEHPGIMGKWWGDMIQEESVLSEIDPLLGPFSSEEVIRKTRYSAFHNTELEKFLKNKGVKTMVITGVMTHLCCETTAREAFIRDYEVYFVIDGTATENEELHLSSLRTLSHGFAIPVITQEILNEFAGMGN